MDETLTALLDSILVIEGKYAYEKRGIKTQRQAEIFKKVDDALKEYIEKNNALKQD